MTIAFFAPLKAPDHPVPSGDRAMARALVAALGHGGHDVKVASDLRLYDGRGDAHTQERLADQAALEVARLIGAGRAQGWRAWLTYHNYYKAPDLIGPTVARALGIPYLQVESTRARKRLTGPWAGFAAAAEAASDAAHTIFYLTQRDAETLRRDAPAGQSLVHLPPFLDRTALPAPGTLGGPMLSVGMMRAGDKLASYRLIADTLAALPDGLDWRLNIAGDGPARPDIAALMAPFGARVTLLGALSADQLDAQYGSARLLLWPGVNEAFGMTYLEAQAAGIPVIAQDRPGVRDVVHCPMTDVDGGPKAMAQQVQHLLADTDAAQALGQQARARIATDHLLPAAADLLTRTTKAIT